MIASLVAIFLGTEHVLSRLFELLLSRTNSILDRVRGRLVRYFKVGDLIVINAIMVVKLFDHFFSNSFFGDFLDCLNRIESFHHHLLLSHVFESFSREF